MHQPPQKILYSPLSWTLKHKRENATSLPIYLLPEYIPIKNGPLFKKSHVGAPQVRFIFVVRLPPFRAATKLPTWPTLEEFFKLGSKNSRNCPPLSTLSIHHDTPCLHQQAFLPRMARTHANALSTEVMQNRMAQRHHLSKALVVSLMKNLGKKERPFDLEVLNC